MSLRYHRPRVGILENRVALSSLGYQSVTITDLYGDGMKEVVGRVAATGNWWASEFNATSQTFVQTELAGWNPSGNYVDVMAGNVTGSGRDSLVGLDATTGNWWALSWNGQQWVGETIANWDPTAKYTDVMLVDLTGARQQEIVGLNTATGAWLAVQCQGNSFTTFTLTTWNRALTYSPAVAVDFQGNGQSDIVARSLTDGAWYAVSWNGTAYETDVLDHWVTSVNYTAPLVVDVDGNGQEVVERDLSYGTWWMLAATPTGFATSYVMQWNPADSYSNAVAMDSDGTSNLVLAAQDLNSGTWWGIGATATGYANVAIAEWSPSTTYSQPIVGDITGNGALDIVARDMNAGTWWAVEATGNAYRTVLVSQWNPALGYANIQLADLDGGGTDDVFGTLPAYGTWWTILNTPHGALQMRIANSNGDWWYTPPLSSGNDAALEQQIIGAVPGLQWTLQTNPFQAAQLILDWASNNADYAVSPSLAVTLTSTISTQSASQIYNNSFAPHTGAGYCGAMAVFGSDVLNLFGFDTFTVDFGDTTSSLTHVSVILAWQGQFYMYDPTFNMTFQSAATGAPMGIFEVMDAMLSGSASSVNVTEGSLDQRFFLATTPQPTSNYQLRGAGACYDYGYLGYSINTFVSLWSSIMAQAGYSPDMTGLMQLFDHHVYSVGISLTGGVESNVFIKDLEIRGIPIGS